MVAGSGGVDGGVGGGDPRGRDPGARASVRCRGGFFPRVRQQSGPPVGEGGHQRGLGSALPPAPVSETARPPALGVKPWLSSWHLKPLPPGLLPSPQRCRCCPIFPPCNLLPAASATPQGQGGAWGSERASAAPQVTWQTASWLAFSILPPAQIPQAGGPGCLPRGTALRSGRGG